MAPGRLTHPVQSEAIDAPAYGPTRAEAVGVHHWRLTVYQRTCRGLGSAVLGHHGPGQLPLPVSCRTLRLEGVLDPLAQSTWAWRCRGCVFAPSGPQQFHRIRVCAARPDALRTGRCWGRQEASPQILLPDRWLCHQSRPATADCRRKRDLPGGGLAAIWLSNARQRATSPNQNASSLDVLAAAARRRHSSACC
jgi:hypothetical protein